MSNNRIIDSLYLAAGGTVYSQPIDMQGDTALAMAATVSSGTGTATPTLEGSYDMQSWSPTGITTGLGTLAASPSFTTGVGYGITYKYARLKLAGLTNPIIVTVCAATFDPN